MTVIEMYRARAEAERHAAEATSLPNRRSMYERSAMVWEEMARNVEDTAEMAATNAAAKAAR